MLPDGTYSAVVDRIEDDLAALEVDVDDDALRERVVALTELPADARAPDAVLEITIENDSIVTVSYDPEATETKQSDAQARFDRLSQRLSEDNDRNYENS
ncbi:MAG: DUF3006 domain-containing protein [Halobacteriales archaeon]|nr:DUF3006 domain-containing protein [Halobacteriales archaeon]